MSIKDYLQLAKTVEMSSIKFPAIAELKYDGVRAYFLRGRFYSRTGKEIVLPSITNSISSKEEYTDLFLDMEITLLSGKKTDRTTVSGMINSAMKGGHDKIDTSLLYFNVFDAMPADVFEAKKEIGTLKIRKFFAEEFVSRNSHLNFRMVEHWIVRNEQELARLYNEKVKSGYEGLVVKQDTSYYQFGKRSDAWSRFKPTKSADLTCVGVIAGKGKYENLIGSLVLSGVVEDKQIEVKAGSGMTDADRSKPPDYYLNQTVEVNYDSITQDKTTGEFSLFQPRFVCVRFDK